MRDFFNVQHPWFRPAWRRAATVAVCFAWALVELSNGAPFWAMVFAAIGAYLVYAFFIAWTDPED